jgi:HSP20 family protein
VSAKKRSESYIPDVHITSMLTARDLIEIDINCSYLPLTDVIETNEHYIIEMELPGVKKSDIKVEIIENVLYVYGIKEKNCEEEHIKYHCMGRVYGKFKRSFQLPGPFNMHAVKAKLDNGILTIIIPKLEEKRSKKIIIPVE